MASLHKPLENLKERIEFMKKTMAIIKLSLAGIKLRLAVMLNTTETLYHQASYEQAA